jgi:hypothetical protein
VCVQAGRTRGDAPHGIKPGGDQDEITEEVSQIKQRDMDKDGKLKIVGKDEVREGIGRSPDTGNTFIMRMYFELLKDASGGTYEQSVSAINRRTLCWPGITTPTIATPSDQRPIVQQQSHDRPRPEL